MIVVYAPPVVTDAQAVARAIADSVAATATAKPVVACFLGRLDVVAELRGDGAARRTIPTFAFPEAAARALGRAAELAAWRARPQGKVPELADADVGAASALIASHVERRGGGAWLDEVDTDALLRGFGIPTVDVATGGRPRRCDRRGRARSAIRSCSRSDRRRSCTRPTSAGLRCTSTAATRFGARSKRCARSSGGAMDGAVVQRMVPTGLEVIVGVTQDPLFGPLLLFGLGGVTAELLADRALRILPVTDEDAHELVRSLRASPLLFGYRGSPALDVAALEDLILRVAKLAQEVPEITEMDLNPVIVHERGVVVVDAKVRGAPAPDSVPSELRRMRD